ncbi:MAG: hypothetical protein JXN60_07935, partial [Lentisphaerae bacterium]|nr:hypothetical protein [Lentisphaerota bacterium]
RSGAGDKRSIAKSNLNEAALLEAEIECLRKSINFDVRRFEDKHGLDSRASSHAEITAAMRERIDLCWLKLADGDSTILSEKPRTNFL